MEGKVTKREDRSKIKREMRGRWKKREREGRADEIQKEEKEK